jgi:hypothetical protein
MYVDLLGQMIITIIRRRGLLVFPSLLDDEENRKHLPVIFGRNTE